MKNVQGFAFIISLFVIILVTSFSIVLAQECIPSYRTYCYYGNVDYEDSCGNYERTETCQYGCSDGKCLGKGGSTTCGDNQCTFQDFESVYIGQDETGQAKFETCLEDCRSDIVDPLDFIVTYNIYYNSNGERVPQNDYYLLDIWNEGTSDIDMEDVAFVIGGKNRGVTQYQNLGDDILKPTERKKYIIDSSLSGSLPKDLCGQEFSFALRKKESDRLYSFDGGKFLNCEETKEVAAPSIDVPIDIPTPEEKIIYICNGCSLDNKCYQFGYRKDGKYCSDSQKFIAQLESDAICENNFECSSNVCVSGQCISESLIQKILNWFKRLFGVK